MDRGCGGGPPSWRLPHRLILRVTPRQPTAQRCEDRVSRWWKDAQDASHQLAPGEEGEPLSNQASSTPALPQPEARGEQEAPSRGRRAFPAAPAAPAGPSTTSSQLPEGMPGRPEVSPQRLRKQEWCRATECWAGRPLSPLGPRLLLPLAAAPGEPRGTAPALGGPHHALSHHPVPEALLTAASHLVRKGHAEGGGRTGQGRAAGGLVQLDTPSGRQSRQPPAAGSQIPTGASGLETLVTAPQVDRWQQEAPWAQQTGGPGEQEFCLPPWTDPTGAWHTRPHLTGR